MKAAISPSLPSPPLTAPTPSAIPLTIVWQSEQSEGNKGAGQVFKEERMSTVSLVCDAGISGSHQTSILRERERGEREKETEKEGGVYLAEL